MSKAEFVRDVIEMIWEKAYEEGADAVKRARITVDSKNARHNYRLGQIAEARRAGNHDRVAELEIAEI